MVPVANRPIMEHVLALLAEHGMTEVVANLHWYPGHDPRPLRRRLRARRRAHLLLRGEAARHGGRGPQRARRSSATSRSWSWRPTRSPTSTSARSREPTRANGWIATLAVKRVKDATRVRGHRHRRDGRGRGLPGEARARRGALRPRQLHDLRARARDLRLLPRRSRRSTSRSTSSRRCSRPTCRSASTSPTTTGTTSARCRSTCRATSTWSPARRRRAGGRAARRRRARPRRGGGRGRRSCSARARASATDAQLEGPLVIGPGATIGAGARRARVGAARRHRGSGRAACWRARSPATRARWRGIRPPRAPTPDHRLLRTRGRVAGAPGGVMKGAEALSPPRTGSSQLRCGGP